jgi:hypothetical protein
VTAIRVGGGQLSGVGTLQLPHQLGAIVPAHAAFVGSIGRPDEALRVGDDDV